ncbi:PREDICTED: serine/threonine-protein kinase LATS1 isoform X3 [Nanorana parkeri]|uniref:serine/threonine-protein kinase LATS1 isoform X3 n=1 Tax=Nanorana parkeri TaxID=125878 RepID=UPI000853F2F1|nr:PREDICTED: serine/threonine-protein kinase LATS1 isoform X3 [Nanorana parkeri]
MKRVEKPEGYRQMRPKTFPASTYTGNSRQMLLEIRESLRHLPKPSNAAKVEQPPAKTEDPRQGRNPPKFVPYHKALAEIRNSLQPFANSSTSTQRGGNEVNRKMLHDLLTAGFDEDMVVRALQQTNSRSIEAAIEFMSYLEPYRDAQVAAAARPMNAGMKPPGNIQPSVNRRQSWKGSKESLVPQSHVSPLSDSIIYGGSEMPGSQSEMGRPLSGSGLPAFAQQIPVNGQRVNPPPPPQVRSVTPPPQPPPRGTTSSPQSWEPNSQTKRYSGNMEFLVSRISPIPPGNWHEAYQSSNINSAQMMNPQPQRPMNAVPVGRQPIIMQTSGNSKFYSGRAGIHNGNGQNEYITQVNNSVGRSQPPPYPMSNGPNNAALQMQGNNGPMSPSAYNNGNLPQSVLVPNRNSHNMDLYNMSIPSHPTSWSQPSSTQSPGNHEMPSWQNNIPVRSNSFNNPMAVRQVHPTNSQASATTVTAITPAPIQQPVKSMRVLKPELQTALAPAHPSWVNQNVPGLYSEGVPHNSALMPAQPEAPNYQGPPPPYPKRLLQQNSPSYETGQKSNKDDLSPATSSSQEEGERASESTVETTEKEKKQITTSPVPVRKNKRDEERRESRIQSYSPQAFKFFMEQHVENILKSHHQRLHRKKQLESEMMRI